jgi:alternate signal-mediated exported protein
MSIAPRTESERRARRVKGVVAGIAGIAMLLGGSTFALWQETQDLSTEVEIKHGNLDLSNSITTTVYDTSAWKKNNNNAKSLLSPSNNSVFTITSPSSFRATPGDIVEIDMEGIDIKLVGTNMKADLELKLDSGTAHTTGWAITYTLFKDGSAMQNYSNVSVSATDLQNGITIYGLDASGEYDLAIQASFLSASNNDGRTDTWDQAGTAGDTQHLLIPKFIASLKQVRS